MYFDNETFYTSVHSVIFIRFGEVPPVPPPLWLIKSREYLMYYRVPGSLAIICFWLLPLPLISCSSCLSFLVFLCVARRAY
jgi:hypothetical protein